MNERIRELQSKSYLMCKQIVDDDGHVVVTPDLWFDKFAELIVEECRYVMDCNKGSDQHTEWNRALSETSDKIKQHFGVE